MCSGSAFVVAISECSYTSHECKLHFRGGGEREAQLCERSMASQGCGISESNLKSASSTELECMSHEFSACVLE